MNIALIPAVEVKTGDIIITGKSTAYAVEWAKVLGSDSGRVTLAYRTAKRNNLVTFDIDDMIEIAR
jgi:hypothetical protein